MPGDTNTVLLEGRITTTPESGTSGDGTPVCRFTIASIRYGSRGSTEVSFFSISTIGRQAEYCASLRKDAHVTVTGRLRQERWETPEGEKRSKVIIYADHVKEKALVERSISKGTEAQRQER